ncbi:MAG: hypothetical protein ACUVSJ_10535 [Anaerolineae bacterium]
MHIRYSLITVMVLVISTLSGCSGATSPTMPSDAVLSPTSTSEKETAGNTTFLSPLFVSPLMPSVTLEPVPSPPPDKGVVTGVLILAGNPSRPMQGSILYLSDIIRLSDGRPAMSSFDKRNAPVTQTNAMGQFIFKDVPPGEYTLIFDLVVHSFVLSAPSGGDLIIKVAAGEVIDLGELRYYDLPGAVQPVPGD